MNTGGSKSILDWREGDAITSEHRNALASYVARVFNLPPEKEAETRERYSRTPDENIAGGLAVMIATLTRMEVDTFKRAFPTIARESKSLAVKAFLANAKGASEQDYTEDLGQIG